MVSIFKHLYLKGVYEDYTYIHEGKGRNLEVIPFREF